MKRNVVHHDSAPSHSKKTHSDDEAVNDDDKVNKSPVSRPSDPNLLASAHHSSGGAESAFCHALSIGVAILVLWAIYHIVVNIVASGRSGSIAIVQPVISTTINSQQQTAANNLNFHPSTPSTSVESTSQTGATVGTSSHFWTSLSSLTSGNTNGEQEEGEEGNGQHHQSLISSWVNSVASTISSINTIREDDTIPPGTSGEGWGAGHSEGNEGSNGEQISKTNPYFNPNYLRNQVYTADGKLPPIESLPESHYVAAENYRPRKIAYLFAGSIRSFVCPKVHWSIRFNVIDSLGDESYTFLRVALEDNLNVKTGEGNIYQPSYQQEDIDEAIKILNPRKVEYFSLTNQEEEMAKNYPELIHQVFRTMDKRRYSMFYNRCQSYKLLQTYEEEHNMKFDWVVLIRLDAAWLQPLQPIRFYQSDRVYVTETGYVPINDQFMLIPRQYSDYMYDLNTKVHKDVYCLGGPDVETWKCDKTSVQSFYEQMNHDILTGNVSTSLLSESKYMHLLDNIPLLVNESLSYCCSDVHTKNRFGYSETIHFRHLLNGKIPIAMTKLPVYLVRINPIRKLIVDATYRDDLLLQDNTNPVILLDSTDNKETHSNGQPKMKKALIVDDNFMCLPECGRLNHNYKDFVAAALQNIYPYWAPMDIMDTRSVMINAADVPKCELMNHPTLTSYQPISARQFHRLQEQQRLQIEKENELLTKEQQQLEQEESNLRGGGNTHETSSSMIASSIGALIGSGFHEKKEIPMIDYSKNLYSQFKLLHKSLQVNPYEYTVWRIHPTKNIEGCLTYSLTNSEQTYNEQNDKELRPFPQHRDEIKNAHIKIPDNEPYYQLFWTKCIDHLRYKGGRRYHPQQLFFLSVLPHHSDKFFTHPVMHNEIYLNHDVDRISPSLYDVDVALDTTLSSGSSSSSTSGMHDGAITSSNGGIESEGLLSRVSHSLQDIFNFQNDIKTNTASFKQYHPLYRGNAYSEWMRKFYHDNLSNITRIVVPMHQASTLDVFGGKDVKQANYNTFYNMNMPPIEGSTTLLKSPAYYCLTVLENQDHFTMLLPCDITGQDTRQWFVVVKGFTPGAHGPLASTIGSIRYAKKPDYCLIRGREENFERTEMIFTSNLKLMPCSESPSTSKKLFDFEHIPTYH